MPRGLPDAPRPKLVVPSYLLRGPGSRRGVPGGLPGQPSSGLDAPSYLLCRPSSGLGVPGVLLGEPGVKLVTRTLVMRYFAVGIRPDNAFAPGSVENMKRLSNS